MNFSKNKIFLSKNIDLHFGPSGTVYVSGPLGVLSNKLCFSFEFNRNAVRRSFKNSDIRHLFSFIKFSTLSVTFGYYMFIDLVGLGYKIKKISSLICRFYLGQSHYVYIYVPNEILF
jgi:ribosomal protein L6P/L9E